MKKVILSIIIILVIVLLGLGGYLLYTKLNAKNIDVSAINIANSAEVKNMVNESSNKVENIVEYSYYDPNTESEPGVCIYII